MPDRLPLRANPTVVDLAAERRRRARTRTPERVVTLTGARVVRFPLPVRAAVEVLRWVAPGDDAA